MFCETAAFAIAGFVVRGPFDEQLSLVMSPAARRDGIGAEMRGLAGAQTLNRISRGVVT